MVPIKRFVPRLLMPMLVLLLGAATLFAQERQTKLLVVGATESGWAATIQAARLGVESITLVHDGNWIGGQFTEQALACVDENKGVGKVGWGVAWHPMKRSFPRFGLFKELMDRIEVFNTAKYGSPMPGRPYHGPSTFRPVEAERIFRSMLQPYVDSGQVELLTGLYPVRANVDRSAETPRLKGLWFNNIVSNPQVFTEDELYVAAEMTIDASDWGDAIQVAGADFECGPDPQSRYNEPSAPKDLSSNPPNEMNPITWAMIVEESDVETPVEKPWHFDDRNYPRATFFSLEAFGHLKWDEDNPGLGAIKHWPDHLESSPRQLSVYTVRRIVDGLQSPTEKTLILLNYMNGQDYPLERLPKHVADALESMEPGCSSKNIVRMNRKQRDIIFLDAQRHALGLFYHMQNFVHEKAEDRTHSFRKFRLSEEFGTANNLPPKPYIRESLRLKAQYMMREQDGRNRDGITKTSATERFASVMYHDGLFAWQFHYDFHRTGRTYLANEGESGPWIDYHKPNRHTKFLSDRSVFPLRSLVPIRFNGLIGAQKNVGYSSIVSAAIRLHDQCIHIGQAAGAIATISLRTSVAPREFAFRADLLERVRHALCGEIARSKAVPILLWPFRDLSPNDPAFVAINRLAATGALPIEATEIDFHPDRIADESWRNSIVTLTKSVKLIGSSTPVPNDASLTRGEFCVQWWGTVRDLPNVPFSRVWPTDADGDMIPDTDDPLPLKAGEPITFQIQPLTAEQDGIPPFIRGESVRRFNFCGIEAPLAEGFENDHGDAFTIRRGYGWSRDIRENNRYRKALPSPLSDTFLFTRSKDRWECIVPNGRYRVCVAVGDSAHEQLYQSIQIESTAVIKLASTASGEFFEASCDVVVRDGRLTVDLGSGKSGSNTCLNWLLIKPQPTPQ